MICHYSRCALQKSQLNWKCFFISHSIYIIAWLLNISCAAKLTEVIGYKGTNISLQISYPANFEKHDKYFGRSDGFFSKKLIRTSQANRWARHGRFALFDNTASHRFTVHITGLTMEDSGLYLCGVDIKLQTDPVSEVQITVRKGETARNTMDDVIECKNYCV